MAQACRYCHTNNELMDVQRHERNGRVAVTRNIRGRELVNRPDQQGANANRQQPFLVQPF